MFAKWIFLRRFVASIWHFNPIDFQAQIIVIARFVFPHRVYHCSSSFSSFRFELITNRFNWLLGWFGWGLVWCGQWPECSWSVRFVAMCFTGLLLLERRHIDTRTFGAKSSAANDYIDIWRCHQFRKLGILYTKTVHNESQKSEWLPDQGDILCITSIYQLSNGAEDVERWPWNCRTFNNVNTWIIKWVLYDANVHSNGEWYW